jgi:hypothetical protein
MNYRQVWLLLVCAAAALEVRSASSGAQDDEGAHGIFAAP